MAKVKGTSVSKRRPKNYLPQLLVLHGPNLNLLGTREPEIYGSLSLIQLNQKLKDFAAGKKIKLKFKQSNSEGELINHLHEARTWAKGIVFNPGAYTHYSYALRDAVAAIAIPTVEVHLSDIHSREDFRKVSVIKPVCLDQISGLGINSYIKAIELLMKKRSP